MGYVLGYVALVLAIGSWVGAVRKPRLSRILLSSLPVVAGIQVAVLMVRSAGSGLLPWVASLLVLGLLVLMAAGVYRQNRVAILNLALLSLLGMLVLPIWLGGLAEMPLALWAWWFAASVAVAVVAPRILHERNST